MIPFVTKMIVDEARENVLTKFKLSKGIQKNSTESDHNTLSCELDIPVANKKCSDRKEVFNFRNEENQKKFLQETNRGSDLQNCFKSNDGVIKNCNKFLKVLKRKVSKCFKKYRKTKKKLSDIDVIMNERRECKKILKRCKDSFDRGI